MQNNKCFTCPDQGSITHEKSHIMTSKSAPLKEPIEIDVDSEEK